MIKPRKSSTRPWLPAMLMVSALLLSACAAKPTITVIPADRMVRELPDGNYEVTPAWLQERLEIERRLLRALDNCNPPR